MADVQPHHGVITRNTLQTYKPLGGAVMIAKFGMTLLLVISLVVTATSQTDEGGRRHSETTHGDIHGGVPMGMSNDNCDNAKDNLTMDWDGAEEDYKCFTWTYENNRQAYHIRSGDCHFFTSHGTKCAMYAYKATKPGVKMPPVKCSEDIDRPLHICMSEPIRYRSPIPTSGPHRPLWAKFGEYIYLPKQRWVHNLEHGCAVFLYHPCADTEETNILKRVARSCLRKHIITPLKELSRETPFAVITYGCKLLLPYVDVQRIVDFLRVHALKAPETGVVSDGQYSILLEKPADIVSDIQDNHICPEWHW